MIEPAIRSRLHESVRNAVLADREVLDSLVKDVSLLRQSTRRIHPRGSTAISIVAADGGSNNVQFNPFSVDLIRVVDSNDKQYCIETLTPNMSIQMIDSQHFDHAGFPSTPLGRMLVALGVESVAELSSSIAKDPEERTGLWVSIYRELSEWAALLDLIGSDYPFGNDTIILFDGLLRTKKFAKGLFGKFQELLEEVIQAHYENHRRRIYVAGIAKRNKFLQQYRLAMALAGVMRNKFPCYTRVPDDLQERVYKWSEIVTGGGEGESYNAGQLFLVKFGSHSHDPVWAVDIFRPQSANASKILGHLLQDAQEGFPIPYYPMSLQRAHEHAALVGLDVDILRDEVRGAVAECIEGDGEQLLDELELQPLQPAAIRY